MSKKRIIFYVDDKFISKFRTRNKSQIVNDALAKYFSNEKEKDKNDLKIISDFIQELKNLDFKFDKLNELLLINTEIESISAQQIKGIKDNSKIDIIISEVDRKIKIFNEFKKITKGD